MKDEYGKEAAFLCQDKHLYGSQYKYTVHDKRGIYLLSLNLTLSAKDAPEFARHNNLTILKSHELLELHKKENLN